jgi:acyl-CoA thioesterase FadM
MLFTWRQWPVWPPTKHESIMDQLALDGCALTVAVTAVQEYLQPLRYGDTLTVTNKLASVSDEKTTRLGTGHFVTTVETFRNQDGEVVGTHTFTLFTYRSAGGNGA